MEQLEPALLEASRQRIVVLNDEAVYLGSFFRAERYGALRLARLLSAPSFLSNQPEGQRLEESVGSAVRDLSMTIGGQQLEAVQMAVREKVSIITGGPGTGKTTCLHVIIQALDRAGVPYSLCAPTGRAAKRMTEATGRPASTIHRLLGYQPSGNQFSYNDDNPLPQQMIIVDEVSMVDSLLFYHLLMAVSDDSHLLLVGDADQLPAVGPGDVLHDVLESGVIPSVRLEQLWRQAENSEITVAAHEIRRGIAPAPRDDSDLYVIRVNSADAARKVIKEMVQTRIPRRFALDPMREIQVMSPTHRGVAGVRSLNEELQQVLNPEREGQPQIGLGPQRFRCGDKVMQLHNDYEKDVYNGDLGRVVALDLEREVVVIGFGEGQDHREVDYEASDLTNITLAYAISVHKSQGSEFPAVVMPLLISQYPLLQRNLLYTGLTRAKQLCVLVCEPRALRMAVGQHHTEKRFTRLADRLREVCESPATDLLEVLD